MFRLCKYSPDFCPYNAIPELVNLHKGKGLLMVWGFPSTTGWPATVNVLRDSVSWPEHLGVTQDLLLGSYNILQGHDPVEHHFPVAPAC